MKRWKPKMNEKYWYVTDAGIIDWAYWYDDDEIDNWRWLNGNVFKNEEEAEEHNKKLEIQAQFRNFVQERNDELDWENVEQDKYHLYYSHNNQEISIGCMWMCEAQGIIYASSEKILRDAIVEIGEYNVIKYILEVKDE